jgi:hypothetical protein
MASTLQIFGRTFNKLSGHNFRYSNIIFNRCSDYHPFTPKPNFTNVKSVTFDNCDKNFVYYWLTKAIFQDMNKLEKIYLNSHPCEKNIFQQIGKKNGDAKPEVFVNERYSNLVKRWAYFDYQQKVPMKNIVTMTTENINTQIYHMSLDADIICNLYNTETSRNETLYIQTNGIISKLVNIDDQNSLGYSLTKYETLNNIKETNMVDNNLLIKYNDGTKENFMILPDISLW